MAFKKLSAPPSLRHSPLTGRMRPGTKRGKDHLDLSVGAREAIGNPRAVFFEWDDEEWLLRIVASSHADPASRLVPESGRISMAAVLRMIGVHIDAARTLHLTKDGPLALIADLSEYRSAA